MGEEEAPHFVQDNPPPISLISTEKNMEEFERERERERGRIRHLEKEIFSVVRASKTRNCCAVFFLVFVMHGMRTIRDVFCLFFFFLLPHSVSCFLLDLLTLLCLSTWSCEHLFVFYSVKLVCSFCASHQTAAYTLHFFFLYSLCSKVLGVKAKKGKIGSVGKTNIQSYIFLFFFFFFKPRDTKRQR
jgi:hypothetical protein